ncbi:MAG: dhpS [Candidatus Aminicenantes bacterium]|jgi:7,8-dihydropterin-6-yl-methyl-4-(beta-D-ribofuranosyl)aminobenzene 5'-phosphate synthase|nr:dhpS [Candidatus Aminicenantes bacterium]
MAGEMNRRDFLKASAVTGTLVLKPEILQTGAAIQPRARIPEAEQIVITVITDNYADALRPHEKIARRHAGTASPLESMLHAEHGLAYHIEIVVDGRSHSFLFDFATDFQGVKKNIELLKLDLSKIEALALSHDHLDHQAALLELLEAKRADIPPGTPFYVGEGFFVGTYMRRPDGRVVSLLALKREDLEGLGLLRIVEVKNPTPLVPGAYLTGGVERVTDYEQVPPVFVAKKGEHFVQEDFEGEQAIVLNAKGRGLVVLSGCAHRGIVNTVKHAQRITGMEEVHAVMGGFHLSGAKPEIIRKTIEDIKAIRPDYVVPTHCTGFEAISTFAREMPDQFILNTAGTRYTISA